VEKTLIDLGFAPIDALRLAAKGNLPAVREVLALCRAAQTASGRAVSAQFGGTVHGLAAEFVIRDTPLEQVRAVLRESLTVEPALDVWAARAAQMR